MTALVWSKDGLLLAKYHRLDIGTVRALHEQVGDTVEEVEDEEALDQDVGTWRPVGCKR